MGREKQAGDGTIEWARKEDSGRGSARRARTVEGAARRGKAAEGICSPTKRARTLTLTHSHTEPHPDPYQIHLCLQLVTPQWENQYGSKDSSLKFRNPISMPCFVND